jgi:uncharacterized protein YqeY
MTIKQQIDQDLKTAMLAKDADRLSVLRGIKTAVLYEEVAKNVRDVGLSDPEVTVILQREAKKRQESADLYIQGGSKERADKELTEKKVIEGYLPVQLTEDELKVVIETAITNLGDDTPAAMGRIIGAVKAKAGGAAEGAVIAKLVKERLNA